MNLRFAAGDNRRGEDGLKLECVEVFSYSTPSTSSHKSHAILQCMNTSVKEEAVLHSSPAIR